MSILKIQTMFKHFLISRYFKMCLEVSTQMTQNEINSNHGPYKMIHTIIPILVTQKIISKHVWTRPKL